MKNTRTELEEKGFFKKGALFIHPQQIWGLIDNRREYLDTLSKKERIHKQLKHLTKAEQENTFYQCDKQVIAGENIVEIVRTLNGRYSSKIELCLEMSGETEAAILSVSIGLAEFFIGIAPCVFESYEDIMTSIDKTVCKIPYPEFALGQWVWDDLTSKEAKIVRVDAEGGTVGYWLDDGYLGGGRHPWELTKLNPKKEEKTVVKEKEPQKAKTAVEPISSNGLPEMAFKVNCVRNCLKNEGFVWTVRGYKMENSNVIVDELGICERRLWKVVTNEDDLKSFVKYSGFETVADWDEQISKFVKYKKWLYRVKVIDKAYDFGSAKEFARTLSRHPLIKQTWTFRGKVCALTKFDGVELAGFTLQKRTSGNRLILKSIQTDHKAQVKQYEDEARNDVWENGELVERGTYRLMNEHKRLLEKSLRLEGEYDSRLQHNLTQDERCDLEDELDNYNPKDLSVPAGFAGCTYKEDFSPFSKFDKYGLPKKRWNVTILPGEGEAIARQLLEADRLEQENYQNGLKELAQIPEDKWWG